MKVFFQGIGVLADYNLGLTRSLSNLKEIDSVLLRTDQFLLPLIGRTFETLRHGVKILPLPRFGGRWLDSRLTSGFDLIHLNDVGGPSLRSMMEKSKPKLFTIHQTTRILGNQGMNDIPTFKELDEKVNELVAPSKFTRRTIRKKTGVESKVIYHGIDNDFFNPYISQERARKQFDIPPDPKMILWNGSINPRKDLKTLLSAIPRVVDGIDQKVLFYIKGKGIDQGYYPKVKRKIKDLKKSGYGKNFKLQTNWIPHGLLPFLYNSSDLFVHTSLFENFGFVITEAMACGVPVIASNRATAPELLNDANLLFKPKNSDELANKILQFLKNESRLRKVGEKCRDRSEKFSLKSMARDYYNLYQRIYDIT